MSEVKIIKIECQNYEGVSYEENGNLGDFISIPKEYNNKFTIFLSNKKTMKISANNLKKIIEADITKEDYQKYPYIDKIKEVVAEDSDNIKELSYGFPELLDYKDITDNEFNNFEKIEKSSLKSDGLWIGNGIRKIELDFNEELNEFLTLNRKRVDSEDKKVENFAYFYQKNNDKLEKVIKFKIKKYDGKYNLLLDTDKMMQYFEDDIASHTFYGKIKIKILQEKMGTRDEKVKYSFSFPFEIKMKNPNLAGCHISTEMIAIDFGTSSTCIAKNKGKDLLSFNDSPKDLSDYENMTAIILYNWQSIYNKWEKENETVPEFKRSKNKADKINKKTDHFDYGDTIKEELEEAPSSKTMDAIISKLKSLPAQLENNKSTKEEVKPFDGDKFKSIVYLTDKLEDENDETLNPIALYGYLIGRALNLQIKDKIYTKYNLTMPVNFNQYKRDRIKESLTYGLKRALPLGLRDELKVISEYEESVALLGVAKKLKHLKPQDDKEASLFAVFDFGGGTLDFAFGLYRKASDIAEKSCFEKENNKYNNIIEIFKTDGELVGGETIIESLSWKLYSDNQEIMKENKIPIYIPQGEEELKNYPTNLFGNRHIDHVNLKSFNENFSRNYFIEQKFPKTKLELFSIESEENTVEVELTKLNIEEVEEFLEEKIEGMVKNFKNVIESTFNDNSERIKEFGFDTFDINDVKILQAGNTCKAKWVKEAFNEYFKDSENVIFLEDKKKEITPKNAVSKGALMLEGVGIFNHSKIEGSHLMPLDRYLWNIVEVEEEGEDAQPTLKKGDISQSEWRSIAKISGTTFTIYHSFVSQLEDEDDDELSHYTLQLPKDIEEEDKYNIWARPYDGNFIECILGNVQGSNFDETKKMIIDLNTGEITK